MNNEYKLEQLRKMVAFEKGEWAGHGAHLTHWGSTEIKPVTLEIEDLQVLIDHFEGQKGKMDHMYVTDLNRQQIAFLKIDYCYGDETRDTEVSQAASDYSDIPDEVIFEHYAGITFVPEDFGTAEDELPDGVKLEHVGGEDYELTAE